MQQGGPVRQEGFASNSVQHRTHRSGPCDLSSSMPRMPVASAMTGKAAVLAACSFPQSRHSIQEFFQPWREY